MPLPDESKAQSASSLIKKFQSLAADDKPLVPKDPAAIHPAKISDAGLRRPSGAFGALIGGTNGGMKKLETQSTGGSSVGSGSIGRGGMSKSSTAGSTTGEPQFNVEDLNDEDARKLLLDLGEPVTPTTPKVNVDFDKNPSKPEAETSPIAVLPGDPTSIENAQISQPPPPPPENIITDGSESAVAFPAVPSKPSKLASSSDLKSSASEQPKPLPVRKSTTSMMSRTPSTKKPTSSFAPPVKKPIPSGKKEDTPATTSTKTTTSVVPEIRKTAVSTTTKPSVTSSSTKSNLSASTSGPSLGAKSPSKPASGTTAPKPASASPATKSPSATKTASSTTTTKLSSTKSTSSSASRSTGSSLKPSVKSSSSTSPSSTSQPLKQERPSSAASNVSAKSIKATARPSTSSKVPPVPKQVSTAKKSASTNPTAVTPTSKSKTSLAASTSRASLGTTSPGAKSRPAVRGGKTLTSNLEKTTASGAANVVKDGDKKEEKKEELKAKDGGDTKEQEKQKTEDLVEEKRDVEVGHEAVAIELVEPTAENSQIRTEPIEQGEVKEKELVGSSTEVNISGGDEGEVPTVVGDIEQEEENGEGIEEFQAETAEEAQEEPNKEETPTERESEEEEEPEKEPRLNDDPDTSHPPPHYPVEQSGRLAELSTSVEEIGTDVEESSFDLLPHQNIEAASTVELNSKTDEIQPRALDLPEEFKNEDESEPEVKSEEVASEPAFQQAEAELAKLKCSDCGREMDMMELSDHVCS